MTQTTQPGRGLRNRITSLTALDGVAILTVFALYVVVGATSFGYDDEFFNVNLVEGASSYRDLIATANGTDVHPPGSYVVNRFLLDLLGSWTAVRVVSSALTATALCALWLAFAPRQRWGRAISWVTVCLNPTILLWCTGIRWYAYLVPLLIVLMIVVYRDIRSRWLHWGTIVAISVVLFYLEYLAVFVVAPLVLIALVRRRAHLRSELPAILLPGLVGAALCVPQLGPLLDVHIPNADGQTSGLFASVLGAGTHALAGQGSFPFHPFGIALVLGNLLVLALGVRHARTLMREPNTAYLLLTVPLLIVVGLTAKFRNLVTLSPAQGLLQARVLELTGSRLLVAVVLTLLTIGNLGGSFNVATHQRTIKGSWNTPYGEVIDSIEDRERGCRTSVVVAWEQAIVYHSRSVADTVVDVYFEGWQDRIPADWDCLVVAEAFRGSLPEERWAEFQTFLAERPGQEVSAVEIGPDPDAGFKRRFDAGIPDHFVTLRTFRPTGS